MRPLLRRLLTHPLLALVFRLYIGGVFVTAAMYKINFTGEFASTIASYQLVPYWGVNLLAVVLPWIELLSGLMLIVGLRAKAAAILIALMMCMFTIAILITLLRDLPISCGCFHTVDEPISWKTVVRDLIWLGMTVHVYFYDRVLQVDGILFRQLGDVEA